MLRPPAPEPLELVRKFVNTVEFKDCAETLDRPRSLAAWLAEHGLLGEDVEVKPVDLDRAVTIRDGLRAVLEAHSAESEQTPDPAAVARLNAAASRAELTLSFATDGVPGLRPAGDGIDAALARILAVVHEAMADGTWSRLKICPDDTCGWAFYDRSRNRSGHWCSMEGCGNRAKARVYRERRRSPGSRDVLPSSTGRARADDEPAGRGAT